MKEDNTKVKVLVFKNSSLEVLMNILNIPLHGSEARLRNKFISLIDKQLTVIRNERQRILHKYTKKDESGNLKTVEGGKSFDISPDDLKKFRNEMKEFLEKEHPIEVSDKNKSAVKIASKLVLETNKTFNVEEGADYDEIAQAFENIK